MCLFPLYSVLLWKRCNFLIHCPQPIVKLQLLYRKLCCNTWCIAEYLFIYKFGILGMYLVYLYLHIDYTLRKVLVINKCRYICFFLQLGKSQICLQIKSLGNYTHPPSHTHHLLLVARNPHHGVLCRQTRGDKHRRYPSNWLKSVNIGGLQLREQTFLLQKFA